MNDCILFRFGDSKTSLPSLKAALMSENVEAELLDFWWQPEHRFHGVALRGNVARIRDVLLPLGWSPQWPREIRESDYER